MINYKINTSIKKMIQYRGGREREKESERERERYRSIERFIFVDFVDFSKIK